MSFCSPSSTELPTLRPEIWPFAMASLFSHLLNKLFILFATKEIAMTFKRFTAALVLLASAGLTHAADAEFYNKARTTSSSAPS